MSPHCFPACRSILPPSMTRRTALPGALLAALWLLALPAGANVLPPGNILFDVMPYDPWGDCLTDATSCMDVDASVTGTGSYLFHVVLYPPDEYGVPLTGLSVDLYWPEDWYLGWYSFCSGGEGTLDDYGPNPHRLEMTFPCTPVHEQAFPAVTLAFYVSGYGAVYPEHNESGAFRMGCPPDGREWPFLSFGEAGTLCEHEVDACGWDHPHCAPIFTVEEFDLAGQAGETPHGEYPFVTGLGHDYSCEPSAWADDGWLAARVEEGANPWDWQLLLDADCGSMEPGTYTTLVHVDARHVGRCLPAVLTVEAPIGVELPGGGSGFAGASRLRVIGPNPSSGPFELAYEGGAAGPVRCAVFDASGREVATIEDVRVQGAGRRTITWDGNGADGRPVMPGVYLVRTGSDGESRSGCVVVVVR